jgi:hypothetical protein
MGIASLGGIGPNQEAAGAGGGMVAFTQGGGIKGYASPPYLVGGDNPEWKVSPEDQIQRDTTRLGILTNELQTASDPAQLAALQSEIANTRAAIQKSQSTGNFPQSMMRQAGNKQTIKVADAPTTPSIPERALAAVTGSGSANAAELGVKSIPAPPEERTSRFGTAARSILPTLPTEEEMKARGKFMQEQRARTMAGAKLAEEARNNYISPFTATTASERKQAEEKDAALQQKINAAQNPVTTEATPSVTVPSAPSAPQTFSSSMEENRKLFGLSPEKQVSMGEPPSTQSADEKLARGLMPSQTDLATYQTAMKEGQTAREALANSLKFDKPKFDAAMKPTDIKDQLKNINELFPDSSGKLAASIEEMKRDNIKSIEQAPYSALLKFSTSLMSTKSPYLLQAIGDAGGVGLKEYNEIQELNRSKKLKLLELDASLAAAQDARKQRNYTLAAANTDRIDRNKKDIYTMEQDANIKDANIKMQLIAAKEGQAEAVIKMRGNLAGSVIAINNAFAGGEKEKLFKAIQRDPYGFGAWMNSQQNAEHFNETYKDIFKTLHAENKTRIQNTGVGQTDSEIMDAAIEAARRGITEKARIAAPRYNTNFNSPAGNAPKPIGVSESSPLLRQGVV